MPAAALRFLLGNSAPDALSTKSTAGLDGTADCHPAVLDADADPSFEEI
jgi:hypothetical protein